MGGELGSSFFYNMWGWAQKWLKDHEIDLKCASKSLRGILKSFRIDRGSCSLHCKKWHIPEYCRKMTKHRNTVTKKMTKHRSAVKIFIITRWEEGTKRNHIRRIFKIFIIMRAKEGTKRNYIPRIKSLITIQTPNTESLSRQQKQT